MSDDLIDVIPGEDPTLWSAEKASAVIRQLNRFRQMRAVPPLKIAWGDVPEISIDESNLAKLPGANLGGSTTIINNSTGIPPISSIDNGIDGMELFSDGSVLIFGPFKTIDGYDRNNIAVLTSGLGLDRQVWKIPGELGQAVDTACIDASDDVYIYGLVMLTSALPSAIDCLSWLNLARLKKNGGNYNGTFTPLLFPNPGHGPNFLTALQGQVIFHGSETTYGGNNLPKGIMQIAANGAYTAGLPNFTGALRGWRLLIPDSTTGAYISNFTNFYHIDGTGTINGTFSAAAIPTAVFGVCLQGTNIVITQNLGLVRLNATTGANDVTFSGIAVFHTMDIRSVASSGTMIYAGGNFSFYKDVACPTNLIRVLNDGSIDTTWNVSADNTVTRVKVLSDGSILVCGYFLNIGGVSRPGIAHIDSHGNVL